MISAATTNNNKSESKTKSGESGIPQNNKISSNNNNSSGKVCGNSGPSQKSLVFSLKRASNPFGKNSSQTSSDNIIKNNFNG
jgi:hypothetical protein